MWLFFPEMLGSVPYFSNDFNFYSCSTAHSAERHWKPQSSTSKRQKLFEICASKWAGCLPGWGPDGAQGVCVCVCLDVSKKTSNGQSWSKERIIYANVFDLPNTPSPLVSKCQAVHSQLPRWPGWLSRTSRMSLSLQGPNTFIVKYIWPGLSTIR